MFKMQAMSHFSDSLKARIQSSGISQGCVADTIGEQRSNFNGVLKGTRPLSDEKIKRLVEIPGLLLTYEEVRNWMFQDEVNKIKIEFPELASTIEKFTALESEHPGIMEEAIAIAKEKRKEKK